MPVMLGALLTFGRLVFIGFSTVVVAPLFLVETVYNTYLVWCRVTLILDRITFFVDYCLVLQFLASSWSVGSIFLMV